MGYGAYMGHGTHMGFGAHMGYGMELTWDMEFTWDLELTWDMEFTGDMELTWDMELTYYVETTRDMDVVPTESGMILQSLLLSWFVNHIFSEKTGKCCWIVDYESLICFAVISCGRSLS